MSLSTIGLDSNSGLYRFTSDNLHLSDGIQFIVVVIGVFSISEILLMLEMQHSSAGMIKITGHNLFNMKELLYTKSVMAMADTMTTLRDRITSVNTGVFRTQ